MENKILLMILFAGLILFLGTPLVIGKTVDLGWGDVETIPKMKEAGDSVSSVLPLLFLFGVVFILLPILFPILLFIFTKKIKSAFLGALIWGVFGGLYALIPYLGVITTTNNGDLGPYGIFMFPPFWPVLMTFIFSSFAITPIFMLFGSIKSPLFEHFAQIINIILWIIIGVFIGRYIVKKRKEKVSVEIEDNKETSNNAVLIGGIVGLIFGIMGYFLLFAGSILQFILIGLVSTLVGMLIGFIIKKIKRKNKNVH